MTASTRRGARRAAALAVATALVGAGLAAATPAGAAVPASFHLTGSGFGHGVGMSQYGAKGQAAAGKTANQILTYYYSGATVSSVVDAVDLRVNLLHAVYSFSLRSVSLATGGGAIQLTMARPAGNQVVSATPATTFTFTRQADGSMVVAGRTGTTTTTYAAATGVTVRWAGTRYLAGPATLLDLAGPGEALGDTNGRYRDGELLVSKGLEAVNVLRLHDEYLRGIAEMPSSWPAAALQAQVTAARTYAYKRYTGGLRSECSCHVYDTTADQVFAGWAKQSEPTWGVKWVAAVTATDVDASHGRIVTYGGVPISALYSSSSGGRTRDSREVFGTTDTPYLHSVYDPWSKDPANNPSYASWARDVTQASMRTAFALPDVSWLDVTQRAASGALTVVTAHASTGATATLDSDTFRSRLGLPSATLSRPYSRLAPATVYDAAVLVGRTSAPTGTTVVVVGDSRNALYDRILAGPLAAVRKAPVLLTTATALPAATTAELTRRKAVSAIVVSSGTNVSTAVDAALRARGLTVTRLGGTTRYDTAAAVARAMGGPRPAAIVTGGADPSLPNAVTAAAVATRLGRPILLMATSGIPGVTRSAITALHTTSTVVIGGELPQSLVSTLPSPVRVYGPDRFETASKVAWYFAGAVGVSRVVVASGDDSHLVDPVSEAPLGLLTVLTPSSSLGVAAKYWLIGHPTTGFLYVPGSTTSLPDSVVFAARNA